MISYHCVYTYYVIRNERKRLFRSYSHSADTDVNTAREQCVQCVVRTYRIIRVTYYDISVLFKHNYYVCIHRYTFIIQTGTDQTS